MLKVKTAEDVRAEWIEAIRKRTKPLAVGARLSGEPCALQVLAMMLGYDRTDWASGGVMEAAALDKNARDNIYRANDARPILPTLIDDLFGMRTRRIIRAIQDAPYRR